MRSLSTSVAITTLRVVLTIVVAQWAQAQAFTVLHSFTGSGDAANLRAALQWIGRGTCAGPRLMAPSVWHSIQAGLQELQRRESRSLRSGFRGFVDLWGRVGRFS